MKGVGAAGKLLMTNHDGDLVAAGIPASIFIAYTSELANSAMRDRERKLEALGQAFDAELAVLKQADAGHRLRQAFGAPLSDAIMMSNSLEMLEAPETLGAPILDGPETCVG